MRRPERSLPGLLRRHAAETLQEGAGAARSLWRALAARAWPPRPLHAAAALALAVAAAGLGGLAFQRSLPDRLPATLDWRAAAAVLERDARPGDAVALAPGWAERARLLLPAGLPVLGGRDPLAALPAGTRRVWLLALPDAPGGAAAVDAAAHALAARSTGLEPPQRIGALELSRFDLAAPAVPSVQPGDAPGLPGGARPGRGGGWARAVAPAAGVALVMALAVAAGVTLLAAWLGHRLAGPWGALLAPALLWLAPRPLDAVRSWPGEQGAHPVLVLLLTVPAAALASMAGGLVHGAWRAARATRRREPGARHERLLLGGALLPLALAALPGTGLGLALTALPFLALLGARALAAAGRLLWPERAARVTAALALLALLPGARAVLHAWPDGAAAWSELAGGAPGAASAGLPRQPDGDAAAGLAGAIGAHAMPGARIWWDRTPRAEVEGWQRRGRLRADLRWAEGPADADLALWQVDERERGRERGVQAAFGTARPVDGVFLDEVPLALLYARPGAWR